MTNPKVFISYSHKDGEWKDRLVTHLGVLQQQGLLDIWEDRQIVPGEDWYQKIQDAMSAARVAILLVSANFLTSNFILNEEVPRLLQRRQKEGLRIFPVIARPCAWKQVEWLANMHVRPKDGKTLSSGNEHQIDSDLTTIAEEICNIIQGFQPETACERKEEDAKRPTYDPRNYVFSVPFPAKGDQVVGRNEALIAVHQQLTEGRRTAIGQTAIFHGLGGLGKTQLAVEYAFSYRHEYPNGVIWLNADQDIDAQLTELAEKALWIAPESEHKHKLDIARQRVRTYSDCLIIFDNLEELETIEDYLAEPEAEPHILVTSRTLQPGFTPVPLDLLDKELSLRMLLQESRRQPVGDEECKAAEEIAETLGGLPLALELAGAYLQYRQIISWQEYRNLLKENLKAALPKISRRASFTQHEADLYSTLKINDEALAEEPLLLEILDLLTWSGPAPMGLSLMCALLDKKSSTELINALGLGVALRLLQKNPEVESYSIHRLVAEVRRETIPLAERQERVKNICERLALWFQARRQEFTNLPIFEAEIDHLKAWQEHALNFAPEQAVRLLWLQAYPFFHRGQYREDRDWLEKALVLFEKINSDDRELQAHLFNDLGATYGYLGQYKENLSLCKKALDIRLQLFGNQHRDTALSLNNVGGMYRKLGQYKLSLDFVNKALAIRQEIFGEEDAQTAESIYSISEIYMSLGKYTLALDNAIKSLDAMQKLYGKQHPLTATSFIIVGRAYGKMGKHKLELDYFNEALNIRHALFGERHPDVAIILTHLGNTYSRLGNFNKSLEKYEQSSRLFRELLGNQHPDSIIVGLNLSNTFFKLGRNDEAIQVLEDLLRKLPKDHPRYSEIDGYKRKFLAKTIPSGFRKPSLNPGRRQKPKKKRR